MIIYYTHKYKELGCESHELLEIAIGDYLGDLERAKELASSMKRGRRSESLGLHDELNLQGKCDQEAASDMQGAQELYGRHGMQDLHDHHNHNSLGGKPYIEGFDKFSISHSEGSWAVLIDRRECGLDIQHERICDFAAISRRFFHEEDAAVVSGEFSENGISKAEARAEFFRIWTKREAFIKAIGSSVVYEGFPPMANHKSAEHEGRRYYIGNIEFPDAFGLYAAICLEAGEPINERLIYKEIYVSR
ncbi:MAG: 4'-phosphopantetheinyl transferase superfamily protein [Mogibacterium sp.]|nr:4'-phosphopantetheinyl transferase superfamily protein [Mogibacterium sp.]